jgi:diacylglycerol kinase family enzyme
LGRAGIVSLVPKLMRGTHLGDPRIRFARTTCMTVDSPDPLTVEADGEILYLGAHHLEIEVMPRHLDLLA